LGSVAAGDPATENGRVRFDVEIRQIFTGLIVRYRGWLIEDAR
jgi:hypothetical protein